VVDIKIFDSHGLDIDSATERKIEGVFFREDYRRVYLDEIGRIADIENIEETYTTAFFKALRQDALAGIARDFNLVIDYAGVRASELTEAQRKQLLDLVGEYVGNMAEGHAKLRMEEVRKHIGDTYFAWIGGTGADAVFYYRIHSPVILIEFDHQTPVALPGPKVPGRIHVHSVVRTPNGNDYGKDLLRQHYEAHKNDPSHGHVR